MKVISFISIHKRVGGNSYFRSRLLSEDCDMQQIILSNLNFPIYLIMIKFTNSYLNVENKCDNPLFIHATICFPTQRTRISGDFDFLFDLMMI